VAIPDTWITPSKHPRDRVSALDALANEECGARAYYNGHAGFHVSKLYSLTNGAALAALGPTSSPRERISQNVATCTWIPNRPPDRKIMSFFLLELLY
jgi:hypothetical protein